MDNFEYTLENALYWGNFKWHYAETGKGSLGHRVVHGFAAVLEFLPVVSQVISVFETIVARSFHGVRKGLEKAERDVAVKRLADTLPPTPPSKETLEKTNELAHAVFLKEKGITQDNVGLFVLPSPERRQEIAQAVEKSLHNNDIHIPFRLRRAYESLSEGASAELNLTAFREILPEIVDKVSHWIAAALRQQQSRDARNSTPLDSLQAARTLEVDRGLMGIPVDDDDPDEDINLIRPVIEFIGQKLEPFTLGRSQTKSELRDYLFDSTISAMVGHEISSYDPYSAGFIKIRL